MVDQYVEDVQLLQLISQGNEDALATLYKKHGGTLYAYALRIMGDQEMAKDVLQDSLLTIWQHASSFRAEGRAVAWLFKIVHNKAMKMFRQRKNLSLDEMPQEPQSERLGPDESLLGRERKALLSAGLARLSAEHRATLELVFFQGMTLQEVARVCDVPVGTVKSRLSYAKSALKGALNRQDVIGEELA